MEAWIGAFVQGGALTIVAFFVYWGMTRIIPRIVDQFTSQVAQMQKDFLEALRQERESKDLRFGRIESILEQQTRLLIMLLHAMQGHDLSSTQRALIELGGPTGTSGDGPPTTRS